MAADFDLRVRIQWEQTGLSELIRQIESELGRLQGAAASGTVVGAGGGQAGEDEIRQYTNNLAVQLRREVAQFGEQGAEALQAAFARLRAGVDEGARSVAQSAAVAGAAAQASPAAAGTPPPL